MYKIIASHIFPLRSFAGQLTGAFTFLLALALLLPATEGMAQGKPQVVQLSGVVTVGDSLYGMAGTSVYVPKAGRGTITNQYGYFSLAVLAGDSVVFSALGYKQQYILIPKNFQRQSYSVIIELKEDPTLLPEVRVFPYSTEELFKRAFLSLELPNEDQKAVAKNLNEEIIARMMSDMPMSPNANFRNNMQLQQQQQQRRYMYPSIPITAWYELINAIKRGDFKNQKE